VFFGDEDAASTADSPRRRSAPLNETSEAVEWPPSYRTAVRAWCVSVRQMAARGVWCMAVAWLVRFCVGVGVVRFQGALRSTCSDAVVVGLSVIPRSG